MSYSLAPRDRTFAKAYGFLSFAKNITKSSSGKYSQKPLDHTKQSATDAFKTVSKRSIQNIEKQVVIH